LNNPSINNQIRAERVRVIDDQGKQIGVMDIKDALNLARERNLDLIQVTDNVEPPVCKIMDHGKYLYQEEKKKKLAKTSRAGTLKTIRLTFNISQHDLEVRANQAEKLLKGGNKIMLEMRLRGREKALREFAKEKFTKFLKIMESKLKYKIERELKSEPSGLTMIIIKT
jgi:translation initiation factor IF-3